MATGPRQAKLRPRLVYSVTKVGRMRHSIALAAALALAGFGAGYAVRAAISGGREEPPTVAMQPGEWETTTTIVRISLPGMPSDAPLPPPSTARNCLTPEQAASPHVVRGIEDPNCTQQDGSAAAGRIRISLQCRTPESTTEATIEGNYTATTFDATQQTRTQMEEATIEIDARIAGRRIGDCPRAGRPTRRRTRKEGGSRRAEPGALAGSGDAG